MVAFPCFVRSGIHGCDIDLAFRKHLGYVRKHADPVVGIDLDLRGVAFLRIVALRCLPFRVDQTAPLIFREIDDVHAVGSVDGDSTAACDKAYDLIARYRTAAFGKTDRKIMDSLDYDAALAVRLLTGSLLLMSSISFKIVVSVTSFFIFFARSSSILLMTCPSLRPPWPIDASTESQSRNA